MGQSILILLMLSCLFFSSEQTFCSSYCASYTDACFSQTHKDCYACAQDSFTLSADQSLAEPCTPLSQSTILFSELLNENMLLNGYSSSNPSPYSCNNYTFSGQYVNSDFISKNFTGIPTNHYTLTIKFNVAYIGDWTGNDTNLRLTMTSPSGVTQLDYQYSCSYTENSLCSTGNTSDCIKIIETNLTHNGTWVQLEFSALTIESDANVQFWGIKDLLIIGKECHADCLTCYGNLNSNCLTCADGFYLEGNVCVQQCQQTHFKIDNLKTCMASCPNSYYSSTSSNGELKCESCISGCLTCDGSSTCQVYVDGSSSKKDIWEDNLPFWIFLIVFIIGLTAFIVYMIFKSKRQKSDLQQKINTTNENQNSGSGSGSGQGEVAVSNETMNNIMDKKQDKLAKQLWFDELLQVQHQPEMLEDSVPYKRRKKKVRPVVDIENADL